MKRILLILIICLGFLLRCWKIEQFPATLYGDEQAFAWNAYNILKLGQDEYGNPYPLQFRSFEDYKAPIPVYLLVPFINVWGLTPFAIRLSIVLASTMTVLVTYYLARLFFTERNSLLVSFLLSISPWHVHLSRGFFEATLSLFFFITGIYFFFQSGDKKKFILISMAFFALSMYSYFTPRILVPVFLIFIIWYSSKYYQSIQNKSDLKNSFRRNYLFGVIFLIVISFPLIKLTLFDKGFSRFARLSESMDRTVTETVNRERYGSNLPEMWKEIFHNKFSVKFRLVKNNYLEQLSPNYWYIVGDSSLRYFTGNMGMFYLLEYPFFIIGLYFLIRRKPKIAIFFLAWILLAPIPASLAGRPFAVRSLAMLPAPFIFVAYGISETVKYLKNIKFGRIFPFIFTFGFAISLGLILIRYYFEYPVYAATWWGWENKAALDYAKERESQYDKIFISNYYSGITLAFAVYNQYDPLEYRYIIDHPVIMADGREMIQFGKYYFGSLDLNTERMEKDIIPPNSLYIGRPTEPEGNDKISAPDDGHLLFVVHGTL